MTVAEHGLGLLPHAGDVEGDGHRRLGGKRDGLPRDVHRQVADPLQIVIDLHRRHDEPQIDGHRLVQGEDFQAFLLDFHLALVDVVVALLDAVGQIGVAVQQRPDRRLNLILDDRA